MPFEAGSCSRSPSSPTLANRELLVGEAVKILRAAGAVAVHRTNAAPWMFHIHSTMRMGLDAADSVLDDGAEARTVKRLFVADNSALANARAQSRDSTTRTAPLVGIVAASPGRA